jgi:hypothetical protein
MNRLLESTDPRFKHLVGEKVECIDAKGQRRVGILDFAGVNEKLHGKFQVTLSRCPIWPVDPATVKKFTP